MKLNEKKIKRERAEIEIGKIASILENKILIIIIWNGFKGFWDGHLRFDLKRMNASYFHFSLKFFLYLCENVSLQIEIVNERLLVFLPHAKLSLAMPERKHQYRIVVNNNSSCGTNCRFKLFLFALRDELREEKKKKQKDKIENQLKI